VEAEAMTISREQSRLIVDKLSVPNRFRLMFGQPFFPEPDVERYEEAMREIEGIKYQTNEPIEGTI
jgi:hypothetical protein